MRRIARLTTCWLAAAFSWTICGCGEGEPVPSGANPFAGGPAAPTPAPPPRPVAPVSDQQPLRTTPPTVARSDDPRGTARPPTGRQTPTGTANSPGTASSAPPANVPDAEDVADDPPPEPQTEEDREIAVATRLIADNPFTAHVAYNNRAVAYAQKGEWQKALADLNKAIEIKPDYLDAYQNRAIVYEQLGEREKARADIARASRLRR